MKLVAILMIRNEERVINRCLSSIDGIVDAYSIIDTGSTDSTIEKCETFLKTHIGQLSKHEWKNFGHNRTHSFECTRDYVHDVLKWDLNTTYGLLIDADMVFCNTSLQEQTLTAPGYSVYHTNGSLVYTLPTFLSFGTDWKSIGVTHEYWSGNNTTLLDESVCFMQETADGSSRNQNYKFIRDKELLETGLQDEPQNTRYIFYLAITYKCLEMYRESIDMFKKRINSGGWEEEIWYSYYSIGLIFEKLSLDIQFEEYMLQAYSFNQTRAEPIYHLADYFAKKGQVYKSNYYCDIGNTICLTNRNSLFIEPSLYGDIAFSSIRTRASYLLPSQEVSLPVYEPEPHPTLPESTEDGSLTSLYLSESSDSDTSVEPKIQTSNHVYHPL